MMFLGYDNYSVSGQGVSGSIKPRYFKSVNIVDESRIDEGSSNEYYYYSYGDNFNRTPQQIYFTFENSNQGNFVNKVGSIQPNTNTSSNPIEHTPMFFTQYYKTTDGTNHSAPMNTNNGRNVGAKYVEWFTNDEIVNHPNDAASKGFLETRSIVEHDPYLVTGQINYNEGRTNPELFDMDGIGAFNVTSEDGITYHYSLPVYQFEQWTRDYSSSTVFYETRRMDKYAYTWLLTAITGPDYYDANGDGITNEGDFGYWVEFNYGKYTDGFVWKLPYNSSSGTDYSMGLKQVYYLNTIKTRSHTALFLKEVREDGLAKNQNSGSYPPGSTNYNNSVYYGPYTAKSGNVSWADGGQICGGTYETAPPVSGDETVFTRINVGFHQSLNRAPQSLKLSKILLVKNEDYNVVFPDNNQYSYGIAGELSYEWALNLFLGYNSEGYVALDVSKDYYKEAANPLLPDIFMYKKCKSEQRTFYCNRDNLILDIHDDLHLWSGGQTLEEKAIKIIDFTQDYSLSPNTDNSSAANKGKLTLNEVKILGKGGAEFIPSYQFSYFEKDSQGNNFSTDKTLQDDWGFLSDNQASKRDEFEKNNVYAWSLKEIVTPIGSKIRINYESDTYASEAINMPKPSTLNLPFNEIKRIVNTNPTFEIFFDLPMGNVNYFFQQGNTYSFHFPLHTNTCPNTPILNCTGQAYSVFSVDHGITTINFNVVAVNQNSLVVDISPSDPQIATNTVFFAPYNSADPLNSGFNTNAYYYYSSGAYVEGVALPTSNNHYGGGVRVSSVEVEDELNNIYKTKYNYNSPSTGLSSGITSFAPYNTNINGSLRYIPMINEIPSPGVMYEYVSVETPDLNNINKINKTVYNFEVLKLATNPKTVDFAINNHFAVNEVYETSESVNWYVNPGWSVTDYLYKRAVLLIDKTAYLGRLLNVSSYDSRGKLAGKTKYNYKNHSTLSTTPLTDNGITQETYRYIYRIFDRSTSSSNWNFVTSSKRKYPSILTSVTEYKKGQSYTTSFSDFDVNTGQARQTEYYDSFGNRYKSVFIPAYTIPAYEAMGSKVDDITNRNMMVQVAANYIDKIEESGDASVISASIQTWNDDWNYRELSTSTFKYEMIPYTNEAWRKHKTYTWKGLLDSDGTYKSTGFDAFVGFDWSTGATQDDNWKKINEITLYDHYSHPLESKDIVGKYASSKMGYNDGHVITSAVNAKYTEFTFSGAESEVIFPGYLSGEVEIGSSSGRYYADYNTSGYKYTHTGKASVIAKHHQLGGFLYKSPYYDINRRYKINVWVHEDNSQYAELNVVMKSGTSIIQNYNVIINGTTKKAGEWYLLELMIPNVVDEPGLTGVDNIEVQTLNTTPGTVPVYYDDLMVHPVTAPMNSYVYDNQTGLVTAIIDNNGMAVKYEYDAGGRLIRTYKEIINKGFVKMSENEINYARQ